MLSRLSALALAASLLLHPLGILAAVSPEDIPADLPVSQLLSQAQHLLSTGEMHSALVYYDAAVARDPSDYLTYFKRATTFLSLGRTAQAADDFNKVLSLKPGFEGAHMQLGKLKARTADWDGAREQYQLAHKGPESRELAELEEAHGGAVLAAAALADGRWEECVTQAGVAIMVASRAPSLREMRAQCRFQRGELEEGMGDLRHLLQMKPGDTTPHMRISAIAFYALGDLEAGLTQIRKCLQSDPDSKECKRLMKQEKAIDKALAKVTKAFEKKQFMTAVKPLVGGSEDGVGLIEEVKQQDRALRETDVIPAAASAALVARLLGLACQAYYEANSKKAAPYCAEALALDEHSLYALLHKAMAQLDAEEFDASIATLNKAGEAWPDKKSVIQPLLQKAQVALKRSKTKDYYKVLGVAHDADERQIKSAYRKLSKVHHPDKAAKQGMTKEDAEKKMASINEAYEVLSDPELRARFDRGDDPNSHEQQNPFHGSPFGQGSPFMFHQGAGGPGQGQQFKFQFGGSGGFPGGFPFGG